MKPHPTTSRRQFLAATLVAGSAPWLLPSRLWAASAQAKPSERIVMGFIGVGTQGRHLLNSFLPHDTVEIVAVCDVDTTRREHHRKVVDDFYQARNRQGFKGCTAYADFRELIGREDIQAVVIATPDHWHAYPVVLAAKAGKDIYCEKPLSLTVAEAKTMLDTARKHRIVFQTGSMQRSMSEFYRACSLVRNGRIGKIKQVIAGVGHPSRWCDLPEEPVEPGLDWDFWLGPAPKRPYNSVLSPRGVHQHFPDWRSYREYSGGMMTDWGAHHFDIGQWGLGMDESGPVEIIPPEDPKKGTGLRYVYASGAEMIHDASKGGALFIGESGKIFVDRGQFKPEPESLRDEKIEDLPIQLYKSTNHYKDFVDCIRSRQRPICDVEVGARSVTVCHLGNLAYWHGRRIQWDPAKWKVVGDREANRWLDVEKRGPWKV